MSNPGEPSTHYSLFLDLSDSSGDGTIKLYGLWKTRKITEKEKIYRSIFTESISP